MAGPSLDHKDDVGQLMGHQAVAYVTKILNTNEAILAESGRRESLKEYFILREKAVLAPVELDSIESDALVAKGKLILCLKSIENDVGGQIKATLVAMANVLFDKRMSVRRDAALHDLWSPVASTAEARIVPARMAAYGRVTEGIDLIAAYPQMVLGGNMKHYIIIPDCLKQVMLPEERVLFDKLRRPVCECRGVVYGFARPGRDFIMSFAGWLVMNRWLTVPEARAMHVLWHDGDDAGAIKRAVKAREYGVSQERVGRHVLVRAAQTFSAEPWREEWWKTAESVTDALAHAKSVSGKSSRCAITTTHVDDCDLDAAKPLRTLVWKVVRTQLAAKDPVQMQKFLGVVREAWDSTSSCRGLRHIQSDYTAMILEDAVKLGFGPIRICTTAGSHHLIPSYCLNSRVILECVSSLEVCCSCHAARASTFPLSLHDSRGLSHAGASGLERKSDTFSVLSHTLLDGPSS